MERRQVAVTQNFSCWETGESVPTGGQGEYAPEQKFGARGVSVIRTTFVPLCSHLSCCTVVSHPASSLDLQSHDATCALAQDSWHWKIVSPIHIFSDTVAVAVGVGVGVHGHGHV